LPDAVHFGAKVAGLEIYSNSMRFKKTAQSIGDPPPIQRQKCVSSRLISWLLLDL
jgi:hypothetical protein